MQYNIMKPSNMRKNVEHYTILKFINKSFFAILITSGLAESNEFQESGINNPDPGAVRLIYDSSISGSALESKNPGQLLEDGETRSNQIGGLGGAIDYTGKGNIYVMTPDRGPGAGETSYKERYYLIEIDPNNKKPGTNNSPKMLGMHYLRNEKGIPLTGDASAHDQTNSIDSLRLDAESVRISKDKQNILISDEYGPFIYKFNLKTGLRTGSTKIPNKFLIDIPSKKGNEEQNKNRSGRQSNRGFEGMAITPSGDKIYTITQDPLIQDCYKKEGDRYYGINNRILEISPKTNTYKEYEYILDSPDNGVSEIVAVGETKFLALERDSKAGNESKTKKVFLVSLDGATNIHENQSLSEARDNEEQKIIPARKTLLIDLLKIGIDYLPEKIEGMTFGPDIDNRTLSLVISTDNDFKKNEPTRIFIVSVPKSLINQD